MRAPGHGLRARCAFDDRLDTGLERASDVGFVDIGSLSRDLGPARNDLRRSVLAPRSHDVRPRHSQPDTCPIDKASDAEYFTVVTVTEVVIRP